MDYLDVSAARELPGLRLVLTAGGPGPWSEAAKAVFFVKGIPFLPVRQDSGDPNDEQRAWCGYRNAPVAAYEDEPARAGWAEILLLAERLAPEPALLPAEPSLRAVALGLAHEICGEEGLGWTRRLMLFHTTLRERERRAKPAGRMGYLAELYGYSPARAECAPQRVAALLRLLAKRLRAQHAAGSEYLVGDALSAVDLYWATFAAMLAPLPDAQCPMSPSLRSLYTVTDSLVRDSLDPLLLAHRDLVYRRHLPLPLDF